MARTSRRRARTQGALARLLLLGTAVLPPAHAAPQANFEIQVYGSETVPTGSTMVELHSNVAGRRTGGGTSLVHCLLRLVGGPTASRGRE